MPVRLLMTASFPSRESGVSRYSRGRGIARGCHLEGAQDLVAAALDLRGRVACVLAVEEVLRRVVEDEDPGVLDGRCFGDRCAPEAKGGQPTHREFLRTGLHGTTEPLEQLPDVRRSLGL